MFLSGISGSPELSAFPPLLLGFPSSTFRAVCPPVLAGKRPDPASFGFDGLCSDFVGPCYPKRGPRTSSTHLERLRNVASDPGHHHATPNQNVPFNRFPPTPMIRLHIERKY